MKTTIKHLAFVAAFITAILWPNASKAQLTYPYNINNYHSCDIEVTYKV